MKKEKLFQILSGAILVALGILIAIFQIGALDLYFGIIAIIGGAVLLAYGIYLLIKKSGINGSAVILACVLLALGITLVIHYVTFGVLEPLIMTLLIGGGAGLVLVGVYAVAKKNVLGGVMNIVIGALAITFASLYIANVGSFRDVFWIIIGILVAVYGVLVIVSAFIGKKK